MRLLFFGTYDVRMHPRVEVLREGFAALGDTVDECNVPLGLDTDVRVRMMQRPWLLPLLAFRLLLAWTRLLVRSLRRPKPDAVVVGYLGHFDVRLARLRYPHTPIALDYLVSLSDTAADRAGGGRVQRALAAADRGATRAADVVVVDTEEQRATVAEADRGRVVVVAVGAPDWWYVPAPRPLPESPLRVAFFGLYTPLQGAPVIGRAIASLADVPGITFTMVGGGQDRDVTRELAGSSHDVTWVDWLDPHALADAVAGHHVCLGIFGTTPKALRVVPNKVYQGAAAGCAVVTSDTRPQRAAFGDAAVYVPPGDADALAQALRDLALDPPRLAAQRQAAFDLARERFRPEVVVAPLRDRLIGGSG